MQSHLLKAKSVSVIDLLQHFKENGIMEKDFANDDEVWDWFEKHIDSGRSSPIDYLDSQAAIEELIMVRRADTYELLIYNIQRTT